MRQPQRLVWAIVELKKPLPDCTIMTSIPRLPPTR